ncbi:MAG: lytic transglycosylase domain-containing protein [Novosphingobium sp.]
MSSMHRFLASAALVMLASISVPARCQTVPGQDGAEWDRSRAVNAGQPTGMAQAIDRWRQLNASANFSFSDYSGFMLTYPGFPEEAKMRVNAEKALENAYAEPSRVAAYFDRFPPVSNPARAQYALALSALQRKEARDVARDAWRGGVMSDAAEAAILAQYGSQFRTEDYDARVDALLWDTAAAQAARSINYTSQAARPLLMARLALAQGLDPSTQGVIVDANAVRDAGYIYNKVQQQRRTGQLYAAVSLLSTRPQFDRRPLDRRKWTRTLLEVAKSAGADAAVRIASSIDDGFAPGEDISKLSFMIRDDYTSLMWLGGTKALWDLGDAARAAPLFYRYGAAAKTPPTRSKGFYWAGRASTQAGNQGEAQRYFELAAAYPDHFYGQLAAERLGRQIPNFHNMPTRTPSPQARAAFYAKPLTLAVREVARGADWQTGVRFYREIADQAETEEDHLLVADLARTTGRRDLGVILGQAAHTDGLNNFQEISFPLVPTPPGSNFTMIHAITRQESQFAQNAISHAGARGLMQLMPGTAREQAGKMGLPYDLGRIISDPTYNITLGDGYFTRLMNIYGSYPLAVAAYNAGGGNVNKWLRANGDPRSGGVDWVDWLEKIPLSETRNYVQRVLENAVVYEAMNPDRASYRGPNPLSRFIGKNRPG